MRMTSRRALWPVCIGTLLVVIGQLGNAVLAEGASTPERAPSTLTTKDKIDILFKEYDTLRTEMISRTTTRFAVLGLLGAIVAFALGRAYLPTDAPRKRGEQVQRHVISLWMCIAAFVIVGCVWLQLGHVLFGASDRVGEIEEHINRLAAGEPLLKWGHCISADRYGFFRWLTEKIGYWFYLVLPVLGVAVGMFLTKVLQRPRQEAASTLPQDEQ